MMKMKKILNVKTKEISERTVRFKISSEVTDRDGDILVADGCDFTNYGKNPVFLPFHDYKAYPLGKVVNYFIEDKAVYADVYFPKVEELSTDSGSVSEKAKLVDFTYHCYKTGMLNAVSVGFIIKDADKNPDSDGLIVKSWELLEFSAVSVPANQDAIAQAVKSFGVDFAETLGMETKSGRRISKETQKTLDDLKGLIKQMMGLIESLEDTPSTEEDTENENPEPPEEEQIEPKDNLPPEEQEPESDEEIEIEEDEDEELEIEE